MHAESAPERLRPLGIGELLDRAVALTVRSFVPLALVYAGFAIFAALVQFASGSDLGHSISLLSHVLAAQQGTGRPVDPATLARAINGANHLSAPQALLGWVGGVLVIVVLPLPTAALIVYAARRYLGELPTVAEAYRAALRQWLPLLGVQILYLLAASAAVVAIFIVVLVAIFAVAGAYAVSHPLGIGVGVVLGLTLVALYVIAVVLLLLAYELSFCTRLIERVSVPAAFTSGLRRVFARTALRRALVFGAAYAAIAFGATVVTFAVEAAIVGLAHSVLLGEIARVIGNVVLAVFSSVFIAIFYLDLRMRDEGLDLRLAARAAAAAAAQA